MHPTLGKLLREFDVFKEVLIIVFFHRILEIQLTHKLIILDRDPIKILNSSLIFAISS